MKKIYTLASGLMLIAAPTFAQYTAVRAGNWHNTDPINHPENTIWAGAEPPGTCTGCTVTLAVVGGGTITLNTHFIMSGNAQMKVGDGTAKTTLEIPNSGNKDSATSNSINLINDNTNSAINVVGSSIVTVDPNVNDQGDYDGVFTTFLLPGTETMTKAVGFAPNTIVNNAVGGNEPPSTSVMTSGNSLSSGGTLPIILEAFNAMLNEGVVDLNWTTALEINGDHFVIERSANAGASWDAVGTVPANGNSAVALNYSFVDSKPVQGTAEYRLQMVDRDGKYAYSPVKTIRTSLITSVSVYPNPARDFVNVTLGNASGFTLVRLYNQGGQLLQEKSLNNPGGTVVPLAVSNYPEGNYIVVVSGSDGSMQTNKVVITK